MNAQLARSRTGKTIGSSMGSLRLPGMRSFLCRRRRPPASVSISSLSPSSSTTRSASGGAGSQLTPVDAMRSSPRYWNGSASSGSPSERQRATAASQIPLSQRKGVSTGSPANVARNRLCEVVATENHPNAVLMTSRSETQRSPAPDCDPAKPIRSGVWVKTCCGPCHAIIGEFVALVRNWSETQRLEIRLRKC